MKKIFTFLLSVILGSMVLAQNPEAKFKITSVAPTIDGVIDDVWANANVYNIDLPFQAETPTLGEPGETTWKALWDGNGIYILLDVTDNEFYPAYAASSSATWEYDKPEIYFDVNSELKDGLGGGHNKGHYQIAPGFTDGQNDGTPVTLTDGVIYSFKVTESNYVAEYYVPFSKLLDKDGYAFEPTRIFGFDVTIIDRDPGDASRSRAVWANVGAINESYQNMDDCGLVMLEGSESLVAVDKITLTGGEITTDNGTLQIGTIFEPANASNKVLKWTVTSGTGKATINTKGLLTAIKDGTVTVSAAATDGYWAEAKPVEVKISGQFYSWDDRNAFVDGSFSNGGTYWDLTKVSFEDGVAVLSPTTAGSGYEYRVQQTTHIPLENKDLNYVLSFKAWASVERPLNLLFYDGGNGNWSFGSSTDPEATGYAEWNINLTTEPKTYTFHAKFDKLNTNSIQYFAINAGAAAGTVNIDSLYLGTADDAAIVDLPVVHIEAETAAAKSENIYYGDGAANSLNTGNFLQYDNVDLSGQSSFVAHIAAGGDGGQIQVRLGSATGTIIGTLSVTNSKGWGTYYSQSIPITATSGKQTIVLTIANADWGAGNLDWIEFTGATPAPTTKLHIEAETAATKSDNIYYSDGAANSLNTGNFLQYDNVELSGQKTFAAHIAAGGDGGQIQVRLGSKTGTIIGALTVAASQGWGTYYTQSIKITPTTGKQTIVLTFANADWGAANLDWIEFSNDSPTAIQTISATSGKSLKVYPNPIGDNKELTVSLSTRDEKVAIYNSVGQKIIEKIADGNIVKFNVSILNKGIYIVRLSDGTSQKFVKF